MNLGRSLIFEDRKLRRAGNTVMLKSAHRLDFRCALPEGIYLLTKASAIILPNFTTSLMILLADKSYQKAFQ